MDRVAEVRFIRAYQVRTDNNEWLTAGICSRSQEKNDQRVYKRESELIGTATKVRLSASLEGDAIKAPKSIVFAFSRKYENVVVPCNTADHCHQKGAVALILNRDVRIRAANKTLN